jgi:hypothetical protein
MLYRDIFNSNTKEQQAWNNRGSTKG